jgi:hypothetical protein
MSSIASPAVDDRWTERRATEGIDKSDRGAAEREEQAERGAADRHETARDSGNRHAANGDVPDRDDTLGR